MCCVLIVDDESATRERLLKLIPWESAGFTTVLTADNGESAMAVAASNQPDLVIADIRMPRVDGIAFSEWLCANVPTAQLVFLSGYDEKRYLKAAIRLHASAYLEKPISKDELQEAVSQAMERIRAGNRLTIRDSLPNGQRADELYEAVRHSLSSQKLTDGQLSLLYRAEPRLESCESFNVMIASVNEGKGDNDDDRRAARDLAEQINECAREEGSAMFAIPGTEDVIILLGFCSDQRLSIYQSADLLFELAENVLEESNRLAIASGAPVNKPENIPSSLQTARESLERLFVGGYGKLYQYDPEAGLKASRQMKQLDCSDVITAIEALDIGMVRAAVARVEKSLTSLSHASREVVLRELLAVFEATYQRVQDLAWDPHVGGAYQQMVWLVYTAARTLPDAIRYYSSWLTEAVTEISNERAYSRPVFEAIRYLEGHLQDNVQLSDIASITGVSPSYLSRAFRKQTGKTFSEFAVQRRMEKARRLLDSQSLRVYEVAHAVGYNDYRHFERTFRKVHGKSPTEYAKRHMGGKVGSG